VQQTGSWLVLSSNRNGGAEGTFGLSGFVTRGTKSTDSMSLVAENANASDGGSFDVAEIHYFKRPGGGAIQVYVDGRFHSEINTSGGAYLLDRATINAQGARSLELRPRGNGPVDIADWAVYRRQRGVTLASLGFSGAQVNILGRWDWKITAYELKANNIPVTVICDSMAASVLSQKKIDACLVGADRIAANGDTANKIGTYGLSLVARAHGVPFYVAAPLSTVDFSLPTGVW